MGKNGGVQLQLFQFGAFALPCIEGGELFAAGLQRGTRSFFRVHLYVDL